MRTLHYEDSGVKINCEIQTTEQIGLKVILYACIMEVLGSILGQNTILTKVFRGFPHSFQANAGVVPQLCHGRFLPDPFQFIISLSSYQ
jgi:hypothetical protein